MDDMTQDETRCAAGGVEDALALMREQATLYERLDALSANQRSLITADDTGVLLAHLSRRKQVVDALSRIAERLDPVRREWSTIRQRWAPPQREEADRLIADAAARLRRMIERDEEDVRVLSARKHTVSRSLRSAHSAGQALSAYRAPAAATARRNVLDESSA